MPKVYTVEFTTNDDTSDEAFANWLKTCPYAKGDNLKIAVDDFDTIKTNELDTIKRDKPAKTAKKAKAKKG